MNIPCKLLSPPVLVDSTHFNLYAITEVSRKSKHTHIKYQFQNIHFLCAVFPWSPSFPSIWSWLLASMTPYFSRTPRVWASEEVLGAHLQYLHKSKRSDRQCWPLLRQADTVLLERSTYVPYIPPLALEVQCKSGSTPYHPILSIISQRSPRSSSRNMLLTKKPRRVATTSSPSKWG